MSSVSILFITLAIINFMSIALAFDTRPLQDFCVADLTSKAQFGGVVPCKDPETVTANDFFLSGLHLAGNTSNPYGVAVASASATTLPGLNNLGLTFMRVDLARNGFFPPHYHPRATELVVVLEGSMEVGFITSSPKYNYFSKVLRKGDVFVVPVGLVHNVRNLAQGNTVALVAFNSQNPGVTNIPNAVLAAEPAVDSVYLSKAFRLGVKTVKRLQRKF
ncbi:putative germin-like protein 2-1 [Salvia miltiorrhiza]|uniref:putative germin-like protein 2-1 n=1 Tax=Salvia miltiorrhiza TaxID=226208 RepID=UPI0025AC5E13|nr:putative germin-like protein 2-1 [Salvia miltiorrhiza]